MAATTPHLAITSRTSPDHAGTDRLSRLALAGAGVLFAAYPLLRPWSDETGLDGAAAMASTSWVVSHVLAMVAFVLLAVALHRSAARSRSARTAATAAWVGVALVLPYYGAEAFGLQAIARRTLADGDPTLLEVASDFRFAPLPITMFTAGLLALAVAGVALAVSRWSGGPVVRAAGLAAGAMLALYLPQFVGTAGVRITHGVALAVGLLVLAATTARPVATTRATPAA